MVGGVKCLKMSLRLGLLCHAALSVLGGKWDGIPVTLQQPSGAPLQLQTRPVCSRMGQVKG